MHMAVAWINKANHSLEWLRRREKMKFNLKFNLIFFINNFILKDRITVKDNSS